MVMGIPGNPDGFYYPAVVGTENAKSFMFSVDYIKPIVIVVVCYIYRSEGQVKLLLDFPILGFQLIDAVGKRCGSPNIGFIGG